MKIKLYSILYKLTLLVFVLGVNFLAFCQPPGGPPPGGGGSSDPPCWDPECVPIDGGVGFLIAAGAVLGAKKIRDYRKQSDE
jgi:hypothetical protein